MFKIQMQKETDKMIEIQETCRSVQLSNSTASQPILPAPPGPGQADPRLHTSRTAAGLAAQLIPQQSCNTLGSDEALKASTQPRQLAHCFPGPELPPAAVDRPIARSARTYPCQLGTCYCWSHLPSLGSIQPSHSSVRAAVSHSQEDSIPSLGQAETAQQK